MRTLTMATFYGGFILVAAFGLSQTATKAEEGACPQAAHFEAAGLGVSVRCQAGLLVVETDGVPVHNVSSRGRHQMRPHNQTFYIPLQPQMADQPSEVPVLGPIAITVTGVVIFSPNTAPDFNWSDAAEIGLLDDCNGHVSPHGHYHYHGAPACPFAQTEEGAQAARERAETGPAVATWEGQVIGYAFDGFPILQDNTQTSSWQLADEAIEPAWERNAFMERSGSLDQCNGMYRGPNSTDYAYVVTANFPYNLGCYAGELDRSLNRLQLGWSDRESIRPPRQGRPRRPRP